MISLGGIELSSYLLVPDWLTSPRSAGSERPTLGGGLVVQRMVGKAGRRITLTAVFDANRLYGSFTHAQLEQIRGIADAGLPVEFVYHSVTLAVVVPRDGIAVDMVSRRTEPLLTTRYSGTLTLLEV